MMLPASMICLTSSGASSGGRAIPLGSAVALVMSVWPVRARLDARRGRRGRLGAGVLEPGVGADVGGAGVAGHRLDDLGAQLRQRRQLGLLDGGGLRLGARLVAGRAQRDDARGERREPDSEHDQPAPHDVQKLVCAFAPGLLIPMWMWSRCAIVLLTCLRNLPRLV